MKNRSNLYWLIPLLCAFTGLTVLSFVYTDSSTLSWIVKAPLICGTAALSIGLCLRKWE